MPVRPDAVESLLPVLVLGVVWIAFAIDLRRRRIPNALTFGAAAAGLVLQSLLGGTAGLSAAATGLGVGLVILLPGYLIRATGAGDVKLMAAVGTFLGPNWVLVAGVLSILAGGLIAAMFAASALISRSSPSPWPRYGLMLRTLVTTGRVSYMAPAQGEVMGRRFPFAVSIALGTTLTLALWWAGLNTQAGG
jgi:prepilin peptidase CpaA